MKKLYLLLVVVLLIQGCGEKKLDYESFLDVLDEQNQKIINNVTDTISHGYSVEKTDIGYILNFIDSAGFMVYDESIESFTGLFNSFDPEYPVIFYRNGYPGDEIDQYIAHSLYEEGYMDIIFTTTYINGDATAILHSEKGDEVLVNLEEK